MECVDNTYNSMSIGVFDSGIGGLSVLNRLVQKMPAYDYRYFADNAHVPYGTKTPGEIYELTKQAVTFLFHHDCDLVILACNTATTHALRTLQQHYLPAHFPNKKILGIVRPTTEMISEAHHQIVGVMATPATVSSAIFQTEVQERNPHITVIQQACPLLVPLIESPKSSITTLHTVLKEYLDPLLKQNIQSLILGCTHYELIVDQIAEIIGPSIPIVKQGSITAYKLQEYLHKHPELEQRLAKNKRRIFYFTGNSNEYEQHISRYTTIPTSDCEIMRADLSGDQNKQ